MWKAAIGEIPVKMSMKDRRLQGVAFLALGVFCFILYSHTYEYCLVGERETRSTFFLFDRHFLASFLPLPGGLMIYVTRFFWQFYEYTALGALVVAVLVTGLGVLLHGVLKRLMGGAALFCALLPCVALATTLSFEVVFIAVGLIVSVGPFLIYLRLPKGMARRAYALAAMPALYLLWGGCFWLFALWVIETEWLEDKPSANVAWKLLLPALAVSLPVIAWRWLFLISLRSAFLRPTVLAGGNPPLSVPAALLCAYLALLPLWAAASRRVRALSAEGSKHRLVAGAGLLALMAVVSIGFCYDPVGSECADYQELYKQKRWDDILSKSARNPSPDLMPQFFTNCALYHKGKLLDEMFRYPQAYGARGLIFDFPGVTEPGRTDNDTDREMYNSDLFFEMGHVNAALLYAFDNITMRGETYENMSRMAECSLALGDCGTAREYVALLGRTLFHRGFARRCERLMADAKARDEYYAPVRARLPTIDLPMEMMVANFPPLLTLVESHPDNRMAFDYLTAWCLLDKDALAILPDYLRHLKQAGYTVLPTHVQEAMLTCEKRSGRPVEISGFGYDPETKGRFSAFAGRVERSPNMLAARLELGPSFGGTFMYYYWFLGPPEVNDYGLYFGRLGDEFRALGMDAEALAHYRTAAQLCPEDAETHLSLADLLKKQGKLQEAAFEYDEARRVGRSPTEPPRNLLQDPTGKRE